MYVTLLRCNIFLFHSEIRSYSILKICCSKVNEITLSYLGWFLVILNYIYKSGFCLFSNDGIRFRSYFIMHILDPLTFKVILNSEIEFSDFFKFQSICILFLPIRDTSTTNVLLNFLVLIISFNSFNLYKIFKQLIVQDLKNDLTRSYRQHPILYNEGFFHSHSRGK